MIKTKIKMFKTFKMFNMPDLCTLKIKYFSCANFACFMMGSEYRVSGTRMEKYLISNTNCLNYIYGFSRLSTTLKSKHMSYKSSVLWRSEYWAHLILHKREPNSGCPSGIRMLHWDLHHTHNEASHQNIT